MKEIADISTQTNSITFSYKWTLENVTQFLELPPWKEIRSEEFSSAANPEHVFQLDFHPKGAKQKSGEYVWMDWDVG